MLHRVIGTILHHALNLCRCHAYSLILKADTVLHQDTNRDSHILLHILTNPEKMPYPGLCFMGFEKKAKLVAEIDALFPGLGADMRDDIVKIFRYEIPRPENQNSNDNMHSYPMEDRDHNIHRFKISTGGGKLRAEEGTANRLLGGFHQIGGTVKLPKSRASKPFKYLPKLRIFSGPGSKIGWKAFVQQVKAQMLLNSHVFQGNDHKLEFVVCLLDGEALDSVDWIPKGNTDQNLRFELPRFLAWEQILQYLDLFYGARNRNEQDLQKLREPLLPSLNARGRDARSCKWPDCDCEECKTECLKKQGGTECEFPKCKGGT